MNRAATNPEAATDSSRAVSTVSREALWRAAWERWKQIARAVGVVQTKFLMVLFYFVMVLPLGLIMRRKQDRLRLKPPQGSLWIPHPENDHTLDRARKQY